MQSKPTINLAANVNKRFDLKAHYNYVFEKDEGSTTDNVYTLAFRHMKRNKPATLEMINRVLGSKNKVINQQITITQEEFEALGKLPKTHFSLPIPQQGSERRRFIDTIGGSQPKLEKDKTKGIYIFTEQETNHKLIGSSRNLNERVRSYFKPGIKNISRFRRALHGQGFDKFTLSIIIIPADMYRPQLEIALEQYYFFNEKPEYNDIPVAGSGGQTFFDGEKLEKQIALRGEKVYVYSLDKTTLHAVFLSERQVAAKLPLALATVGNTLDKGSGNL